MDGVAITFGGAAPAALTTLGIIALLLGSSVLAAFVTVGVNWLREWIAETKNRKFAAFYLALALEKFGEVCSDAIYASDNHESETREDPTLHWVPSLPEYPDVDWKAFGVSRTVEAMTLRVEVETRNTEIRDWSDYDDDYAYEHARRYTAEVGLRAIALAEDFRRSAGLPKRDLSKRTDHFREVCDKLNELDKKREAKQAAGEDGLSGLGPPPAPSAPDTVDQ